jgi:hypothetical protein
MRFVVAQSPNGGSRLARIDEGTFWLSEGSSIDLTDRKILLAIPPQIRKPSASATRTDGKVCSTFLTGEIEILVFGVTKCVRIGDRIDLRLVEPKSFPLVEDLGHCLLDVSSVSKDGKRGVRADFRLSCKQSVAQLAAPQRWSAISAAWVAEYRSPICMTLLPTMRRREFELRRDLGQHQLRAGQAAPRTGRGACPTWPDSAASMWFTSSAFRVWELHFRVGTVGTCRDALNSLGFLRPDALRWQSGHVGTG